MQRGFRRLLAMALVVVICLGTAGAEGLYEDSVQGTIRLYGQHYYWITEEKCTYVCCIPLRVTEKNSTVCTSGCMLYAFMHAVSWCRQEKLYTIEAMELLKEFIAENDAPWDVQYVVDDCYWRVVRAHDVEVLPAPPETEEEMIALLSKTGAVICNMGGHCTVAMGYTYHDYDGDGDEDMMLHMLDSALWSSMVKQEIYDFEDFELVEETWKCEGEFWLPFTTYVKLDRLALVPMASLEEEN